MRIEEDEPVGRVGEGEDSVEEGEGEVVECMGDAEEMGWRRWRAGGE